MGMFRSQVSQEALAAHDASVEFDAGLQAVHRLVSKLATILSATEYAEVTQGADAALCEHIPHRVAYDDLVTKPKVGTTLEDRQSLQLLASRMAAGTDALTSLAAHLDELVRSSDVCRALTEDLLRADADLMHLGATQGNSRESTAASVVDVAVALAGDRQWVAATKLLRSELEALTTEAATARNSVQEEEDLGSARRLLLEGHLQLATLGRTLAPDDDNARELLLAASQVYHATAAVLNDPSASLANVNLALQNVAEARHGLIEGGARG